MFLTVSQKKVNSMENMEIKAGKGYMTRDGHKVVIYAIDKGGEYPVHGAILLSDGKWGIDSWILDGRYDVISEDIFDIVSEWIEPIDFDWDSLPAWADRFIAMDDDDNWYGFENKPIKEEVCWDNNDYNCCRIPTSHIPKNFTGDWKESLYENPKYK